MGSVSPSPTYGHMMNLNSELGILFSMFLTNLPKLIVSVVAVSLNIGRKKELGPSGNWALMGFGLFVVLSFLVPVVQAGVQQWMRASGDYSHASLIYGGMSFIWSLLNAVGTGMLLVAVLKGRPKQEPASPPFQDRRKTSGHRRIRICCHFMRQMSL